MVGQGVLRGAKACNGGSRRVMMSRRVMVGYGVLWCKTLSHQGILCKLYSACGYWRF